MKITNKSRILITGGAGFLGQHLIKALLKKYPKIKIIVIDKKINPFPVYNFSENKNIKIYYNKNICDYINIVNYFNKIDIVFHLAGFISFYRKDKKQLFKVNIKGTENVLKASYENKVKKVLHISSVAGIGYLNKKNQFADENLKFNWQSVKAKYYMLSKHQSELICQQYTKIGLDVCIINPGLMYGPGDYFNAIQLISNIKKKKIPFLLPGGTNVVDVRDVANGLIKVMEKGETQERYILGGWNLTFLEIFTIITKILKIRNYQPKVLSFYYHKIITGLINFLEIVLPFKLPISTDLIDSGFKFRYFSSLKAEKQLNYKLEYDFETTIIDSIKYYQRYHLL